MAYIILCSLCDKQMQVDSASVVTETGDVVVALPPCTCINPKPTDPNNFPPNDCDYNDYADYPGYEQPLRERLGCERQIKPS